MQGSSEVHHEDGRRCNPQGSGNKFSGHFSTLTDNLEGCKALSERYKEALGVQRHVPQGFSPRSLQCVEWVCTVIR